MATQFLTALPHFLIVILIVILIKTTITIKIMIMIKINDVTHFIQHINNQKPVSFW